MKAFQTSKTKQIYQLSDSAVNSYAIVSAEQTILVDTAVLADIDTILSQLEKIFISPNNPILLLLTHCHSSYPLAVKKLKRKFPHLFIAAQEATIDFLENRESNFAPGGFSIWAGFLKLFKKLVGRKSDIINVDMVLSGSEMLEEGITVVYTPGHTDGSISVIVDNEVALIGDTIRGGGVGCSLPIHVKDYSSLALSWEKLLKETNCHTFLPGQGRPLKRRDVHEGFKKYFYEN